MNKEVKPGDIKISVCKDGLRRVNTYSIWNAVKDLYDYPMSYDDFMKLAKSVFDKLEKKGVPTRFNELYEEEVFGDNRSKYIVWYLNRSQTFYLTVHLGLNLIDWMSGQWDDVIEIPSPEDYPTSVKTLLIGKLEYEKIDNVWRTSSLSVYRECKKLEFVDYNYNVGLWVIKERIIPEYKDEEEIPYKFVNLYGTDENPIKVYMLTKDQTYDFMVYLSTAIRAMMLTELKDLKNK